jgi:uncharacterized protein with HEPN domain
MKVSDTERNIDILNRIIKYCDQLDTTREFFGDSLEELSSNDIYRSAAAMCVLQIGELTNYLTDDFKSQYSVIPWQKIKDMRNIAAHRYGEFKSERLWATMENDIDPLREYCKDCMAKLESGEKD